MGGAWALFLRIWMCKDLAALVQHFGRCNEVADPPSRRLLLPKALVRRNQLIGDTRWRSQDLLLTSTSSTTHCSLTKSVSRVEKFLFLLLLLIPPGCRIFLSTIAVQISIKRVFLRLCPLTALTNLLSLTDLVSLNRNMAQNWVKLDEQHFFARIGRHICRILRQKAHIVGLTWISINCRDVGL